MPYVTLGLTAEGDIDPARLWVSGRDAVEAELVGRLGCARGTYRWDLTHGLDLGLAGGALGWAGAAAPEIERVARETPGVVAAEVVETGRDAATREVSFELRVEIDGEARPLVLDLADVFGDS